MGCGGSGGWPPGFPPGAFSFAARACIEASKGIRIGNGEWLGGNVSVMDGAEIGTTRASGRTRWCDFRKLRPRHPAASAPVAPATRIAVAAPAADGAGPPVAAPCGARGGRAPNTVFLLNDVPVLSGVVGPTAERLRDWVAPGRCIALYVGNLSRYRGIELLVEAAAELPADAPVDILAVGGPAEAVTRFRALAAARSVASRVTFLGPRPLADLPALLQQADILLSPRTEGDNTPMKIYSYMNAERAILATDLRTHTQVLDGQRRCWWRRSHQRSPPACSVWLAIRHCVHASPRRPSTASAPAIQWTPFV